MSEYPSQGSSSWAFYSDPTSSGSVDTKAPPKGFGSPMNAISFGFVATAILIALFLIMAIFEQLFGPGPSFSSPEYVSDASTEDAGSAEKPRNSHLVSTSINFHLRNGFIPMGPVGL